MNLKQIIEQNRWDEFRIRQGVEIIHIPGGVRIKADKLLKDINTHTSKLIDGFIDLLDMMKNTNEMLEMRGIRYTKGFEKALTDLKSQLIKLKSKAKM